MKSLKVTLVDDLPQTMVRQSRLETYKPYMFMMIIVGTIMIVLGVLL